jgi:thiosulfate reductase cytochrome b subunit
VRTPLVVRLAHWIVAVGVVALVVSGMAILLAHPRLYWGETGTIGTPALIELPLPLVLTGQTGWGRYLHFLAAWACVLSGLAYLVSSARARRFGRAWRRIYTPLQRRTYVVVVFLLFPAAVWTGLAMSPAVTSVLPALATSLGGHQSARTIHFVVALAIVVFAIMHVVMVAVSGFLERLRGMTIGARVERA